MKVILKFVCIVVMLFALLQLFSQNTFAYFTDAGSSSGNTFTAGVWDSGVETPKEADFLKISDSSKLTGNGRKLHGITLMNVNETWDISIDKIRIWWNISSGQNNNLTNATNTTINITEIRIGGGTKFYSGVGPLGESLDGEDYVLKAISKNKIKDESIEFYFDGDASSFAPFTISFIMGDGSEKSFVTDPKYRDSEKQSSDDQNLDSNQNLNSDQNSGLESEQNQIQNSGGDQNYA